MTEQEVIKRAKAALAKQEKLKAQQYKQHSEITILSSLITAAGFGHLVAEARVQALASLESTGMLAAYQTK